MLDPERLQRLIAVGRSLVSELDLDIVLERLLDTAQELTGARYAALGIMDERRRELDQFLTRGIDEEHRTVIGELPRGRGILGVLITDATPLRLDDLSQHPASFGFPEGHPPMGSFLGVPVIVRGEAWGNLYLTEKDGGFDADDEEAAVVLAAWAAIAVGNAQAVAEERLRRSMEASEAERRRWARELHDETLQGLAALKVMLGGAARLDDPARMRDAMAAAGDQVGREIDNLRAIITELRPAALDELGLVPALRTLAQRTAARVGLEMTVALPEEDGVRLAPEVETTVYRVAQEALTNVAKHAGAARASLVLRSVPGALEVEVADDGDGFDPAAPTAGFGLVGMRERVALAGGTFAFEVGGGWTRMRARIPLA